MGKTTLNRWVRLGGLLALVVVAVAVAGCGGTKHKSTHTGSPGSSGGTTSSASPPRGIATATDVVPGNGGNDRLRLTIYDLRREGAFMVLDFGFQCLSAPNSSCSPWSDFPLPEMQQSSMAYQTSAHTPNGITLVDPVGLKQYQPVIDSQQRPYTSLLPYETEGATTYLAWVKFPAPPTTATSMDVLFPNGGPVVDSVPVSSAPGTPAPSSSVQAAQASPFATPPNSTTTAGLTLPVENLVLTAGNPAGSESSSAADTTITLRSDVLFDFDKATLTPRARTTLRSVAARIGSRAVGPVKVTGYTDSIGSDSVNIPLSQARAASVAASLKPLTSGVTFQTAGLGSADPVAPNTRPDGSDNPAGRALNRRVTITIPVKAAAKPAPPAPSAPDVGAASASGSSVTYRAVVKNYGSSSYTVTADRMFRNGNLTALELTIVCTGATGQRASSGCGGEWDFVGSQTTPPIPESQFNGAALASWGYLTQISSTLSALYVVDPASGTQYIPVYNSSGVPVTSALTPFNWLPGTSYQAWVYFPSLGTASSATLVMPGGGARVEVPIAAGPSG